MIRKLALHAVLLFPVLIAPVIVGCDKNCGEIKDPDLRERCEKGQGPFCLLDRDFRGPQKKGPPQPRDRYYGMVFHKDGHTFAFSRPPRDLWSPFLYQMKFGVFNPANTAGLDGAIFGLELDRRGSDPLEFYGIFAQFTQGGLNVFVSSHDGNHGAKFYPETLIVEVAAQHDGTDLVFSARPSGSQAEFDEIARLPLPDVGGPLNAGFGAFSITGEAEVGFDCFRVVFNGESPTPLSPAHVATDSIFDVLHCVAEAGYALDEDPDEAAARDALNATLGALAVAQTDIAAIDAPGKKSPARIAAKNVKKATKKIGKAKKLLDKKGAAKADKIIKNLLKAGLLLIKAGDEILPEDLRNSLPPGSDTLK